MWTTDLRMNFFRIPTSYLFQREAACALNASGGVFHGPWVTRWPLAVGNALQQQTLLQRAEKIFSMHAGHKL